MAVKLDKQEYYVSYSNRLHGPTSSRAGHNTWKPTQIDSVTSIDPSYSFFSFLPTQRRRPTLCFLHEKYTHSSNVVHPPLLDDDLPNEHIPFSLKLRDCIRDRPLVHVVGRRRDDR